MNPPKLYSNRLIDHVYVNVHDVYSLSGVVPIAPSDHDLLYDRDAQNDNIHVKFRDQKMKEKKRFSLGFTG